MNLARGDGRPWDEFEAGPPGGGALLMVALATLFAGTLLIFARFMGVPFRSAAVIAGAFGTPGLVGTLFVNIIAFALETLLFLIPVWLGWRVARATALLLLRALYQLPDEDAAADFLDRLIRGASDETVAIDPASFPIERFKEPILRVGGPGHIFVDNGSAVLTERNGRFQHVLGAGRHALERFEYVHSVVDLRQQERARWEGAAREADSIVRLMTQDGIEMSARVSVIYRICPDDENCPEEALLTTLPPTDLTPTLPTRRRPYPFGSQAVRRAAYAQAVWRVGGAAGVHTWADLAPTIAVDALRIAAASLPLEDLIHPINPAAEPHILLQHQMEDNARFRLRRFGVHLISARIDEVAFPPPVTDQLIKTWQAPREIQRRVAAASVEARTEADLEVASAAQREAILRGILEGIERAKIDHGVKELTREAVALRVADALEHLQRRQQNRLT